MTEVISKLSYAQELERGIDTLIAKAIANQPHTINRLSPTDFSKLREAFLTLAKSGSTLAPQAVEDTREPSEGGPQYINDNPTPWP